MIELAPLILINFRPISTRSFDNDRPCRTVCLEAHFSTLCVLIQVLFDGIFALFRPLAATITEMRTK